MANQFLKLHICNDTMMFLGNVLNNDYKVTLKTLCWNKNNYLMLFGQWVGQMAHICQSALCIQVTRCCRYHIRTHIELAEYLITPWITINPPFLYWLFNFSSKSHCFWCPVPTLDMVESPSWWGKSHHFAGWLYPIFFIFSSFKLEKNQHGDDDHIISSFYSKTWRCPKK